MTDATTLSHDEALALARARHDQTWQPVPLPEFAPAADYDPMATSYRADRVETGWLFTPTVAGLDVEPGKATLYPYYLVEDTGDVRTTPYADGVPAQH